VDGVTVPMTTDALRPPELRVLLVVLPDLRSDQDRPIKQRALAHQLNLTQPRVSVVLRRLVDRGCLVRGHPCGQQKTYRVRMRHRAIRRLLRDGLYQPSVPC